MKGTEHVPARRLVFGLTVLTAVVAITAQIIEGPPGGGYGWGSVAISCLLIATPLVALGVLVWHGSPREAWAAVAVATVILVVVGMALVGNWPEQSSTARALDAVVATLVLAAAVGSIALEAPLLRRRAV